MSESFEPTLLLSMPQLQDPNFARTVVLLCDFVPDGAFGLVLNRPTDWAVQATVMSYGTLFMLGAAYTLQKGAHVRTDMFWEKFSDRTKGIIDAIAYALLFLPSMAILCYISFDEFTYAWSIGERSTLTEWQPPLWPYRAVVPVAAALLFVQGISELMKSLWAARTGALLVHHEKIEI